MLFGIMDEVRLVMKLHGKSRAPDVAVKELLNVAGEQKIVGWYQFPNSLLLFSINPGNPESGTIHIYDSRRGRLYVVDFYDRKFGGYSEADFRTLIREGHFLKLAAEPWLLETPSSVFWFVEPGCKPELIEVVRVHLESGVETEPSWVARRLHDVQAVTAA
jgi:hypothetical protein